MAATTIAEVSPPTLAVEDVLPSSLRTSGSSLPRNTVTSTTSSATVTAIKPISSSGGGTPPNHGISVLRSGPSSLDYSIATTSKTPATAATTSGTAIVLVQTTTATTVISSAAASSTPSSATFGFATTTSSAVTGASVMPTTAVVIPSVVVVDLDTSSAPYPTNTASIPIPATPTTAIPLNEDENQKFGSASTSVTATTTRQPSISDNTAITNAANSNNNSTPNTAAGVAVAGTTTSAVSNSSLSNTPNKTAAATTTAGINGMLQPDLVVADGLDVSDSLADSEELTPESDDSERVSIESINVCITTATIIADIPTTTDNNAAAVAVASISSSSEAIGSSGVVTAAIRRKTSSSKYNALSEDEYSNSAKSPQNRRASAGKKKKSGTASVPASPKTSGGFRRLFCCFPTTRGFGKSRRAHEDGIVKDEDEDDEAYDMTSESQQQNPTTSANDASKTYEADSNSATQVANVQTQPKTSAASFPTTAGGGSSTAAVSVAATAVASRGNSSVITQTTSGPAVSTNACAASIVQQLQQQNNTKPQQGHANVDDETYSNSNTDTQLTSTMDYSTSASLEYRQYILPPLLPQFRNKKTLVLDLDETLVHSSFKYVKNADYVIPVEIDGFVHNVYVCKRPLVDRFMQVMGQLFEIVVFTASLAKYADPVLDELDIHKVVTHRLFRESCSIYPAKGVHYYVKDLSLLGRELSQVIIIDNSSVSYMYQPQNALPITSWIDDPDDTELEDMTPFLEQIAKADSVYSLLQDYMSIFKAQNMIQ